MNLLPNLSLDDRQREQLCSLRQTISDAQRQCATIFDLASPDLQEELKWTVANLHDAAADVAGIVANTEPMSCR